MSQIAVIGAGSVGAFFAAHLQGAGHDVVACARRPFDRYVIESDSAPIEAPATVLTDPGRVNGPVDVAIVAVKAHQTDGAAGWLERLCGPDTIVVVAQNGIEHDRVAPYVNGAQIVPTVVYCGTELVEPGHVRHRAHGLLMIPEGGAADRLQHVFENSEANVAPRPDFVTQMWRKLGINVVCTGLTALTGRTIEVIGAPGMRTVAAAMFAEVWAVGAAEGAEVDPSRADDEIDPIVENAAGSLTSMLQDVRAGRPTEHDALHGAVLRRGAEHDIDTPMVAAIHALLDNRLP